ncbi:BTAD domain-containing putative transcriptional regulator [Dactylosporangium sp. NPDC049525]|uniref:AfsR/SARP family transcriptional regulator n=1 Tax=Dactylosporangium sp. NPDC049525 TaxID=3154730 RepID=UPI00341FBE19
MIQKYVGALRRVLQPELPTREAGSFLLRHGSGYVFAAGPGTLDLVSFRELAEAGRTAAADGRPETALARYLEALHLWQGTPGAGFPPGPAAMPVFAALHHELFDACLAATRLALALDRPEQVLALARRRSRPRLRPRRAAPTADVVLDAR